MTLSLYNTLTRKREPFAPEDANHVRMYVCGPTVYDRPHIGNARSVVVYDVLYRLLAHLYPRVTYVRNITDVDDKINARARAIGVPIQKLTAEITAQFHEDMNALGCLPPTHEPRATGHIKEMIAIIQKLLDNKHAYIAQDHVMFDTASVTHYAPGMGDNVTGYVYGMLSHRVQDELIAGARVATESYKKNPGDFVLWKPADAGDDVSSVFPSPWGEGRPGWHIECSAMSSKYLGDNFDLHGGGADLMFPHHENEIAQSRCANRESHFAKYWVHNGFLTVNGEKMSKSLGNFITVRDLLEKGVGEEDIRLALLMTRYSEPLDWSDKLLSDAKKTLDKWYRHATPADAWVQNPQQLQSDNIDAFIAALCDDMNFPKAISLMHAASGEELRAMGNMLGVLKYHPLSRTKDLGEALAGIAKDKIDSQITARATAKKSKNFAEADRIRKALADQGIILEDRPDGTTDWRRA